MAQANQTTSAESKDSGLIKREPGDLGVPMLRGTGNEPTGPEDALGEGPTRGDYSKRVGPESYHPHETVPTGERRDDGTFVGRFDDQRERVEQGDTGDGKGGVAKVEPLAQ